MANYQSRILIHVNKGIKGILMADSDFLLKNKKRLSIFLSKAAPGPQLVEEQTKLSKVEFDPLGSSYYACKHFENRKFCCKFVG